MLLVRNAILMLVCLNRFVMRGFFSNVCESSPFLFLGCCVILCLGECSFFGVGCFEHHRICRVSEVEYILVMSREANL